jgi:rod shape-determining protein MreD
VTLRGKHPRVHWLRFGGLLLACTVLQASLLHTLAIGQMQVLPNILLILLVFVTLYCNSRDLMIAAFIIGLAADIIGPIMGPNTLAFGLVGSLLGELRRYLVVERVLHQLLTVTSVGILVSLLTGLLLLLKGHAFGMVSLARVLGDPVYSAMLAPLLFPLLHLSFGTPRRYRRILLF